MGCNGSKLEHLEAVALCKDRCQLLESAIHHRYSLAQAHFSYLRSLASIGISLQRFLHRENASPSPLPLPLPSPSPSPSLSPSPSPSAPAPAPVVSPPVEQNSDPDPVPIPAPAPAEIPAAVKKQSVPESVSQMRIHSYRSDSDSETVIEFPLFPSTDDECSGADEIVIPSPARHYMKYMQSTPAPPFFSYEVYGLGAFHVEEEKAAAAAVAAYPYYDPGSYFYHPNGFSNYGGGFGGFDASSYSAHPPQLDSSGYLPPWAVAAAAPESSSSKDPLLPPSPPRTSPWDFLNPFSEVEGFYPTYTPSHDSKELREQEGIPDLEEDDYRQEITKEEDGEEMLAAKDGSGDGRDSKVEDDARNETVAAEIEKPSDGSGNEKLADEGFNGIAAEENERVELDETLVDTDAIVNEEDRRGGSDAAVTTEAVACGSSDAAVTTAGGPREVPDVVREIKEQFDRASESGIEVSKMLEVGKRPYRGRNAAYKVPSKILDVSAPLSVVSSQPSSFRSVESISSAQNTQVNSRNLSSTMRKLYIWEKKLYEEVKAEEELRMVHDRKFRRLKRLDERGEEAHKLLSIQLSVRKLSAKMGMAIQVVDTISSKINKLRDEELWTQINELIHGLFRMWKVMLECHRSQCQIISEATIVDDIASDGNLIDAHMEATMQLELELLNWLASFYAWISAQKGYVKALNEWLMKCLNNVIEETDDGIAPFSPGRIGAPPVFVIFYQWSQAMERLAENEIFAAMQTFSMSVLQLWEQYNEAQRQRMTANNNMERRSKALDRNKQKMKKALQSVNKKLLMASEQSGVPLPGQLVPHNGTANVANVHGLKQIFEAMEKFSEESMKVYEQLQIRSGELLSKENAKES